MKHKTTFFVFSSLLIGLIFFSAGTYAQQKSDESPKAKKTITIHVTKEVDGNKIVIDTTVVTYGDFDADAFLEEKGVINDMPEAGKNVEKQIIIRHPGNDEFGWNDSRSNGPDTIIINDDKVFVYKDNHDMLAPPIEGIPFNFNFDMPQGFHPMHGPQFEDMLEGMARTYGLENIMPFGEMKQVVVKKKRNGKKVIITFEDRKDEDGDREQGNSKKQEKVIIYGNGDQGSIPQNEERVMVKGNPGENIIIHKTVKKTANGDQVIINAEVENPSPVKTEKKVIIITEEGTK